MTEFFNQIFLDNKVSQWGILLAVTGLVILFNPVVGRILGKLVYRIFQRFAPNEGERFVKLLLGPLEGLLVLGTIATALEFMTYPSQLDFSVYGLHMHRILSALLQLLIITNIAWLMLRAVDFLGEVLGKRAAQTETTQDDQYVLFMRDVLKVVVYILFLFVVFGSVLDMNITSLLAGAGLAGLAVALAAQDSLANLFGSLTIFSEKPFIMGDLVETNGVLGTVEKVGFRSTRIRTLDKTYVTLPNRKIMETSLNNLSERTFRRVSYNVGLLYGTPAETIQKIARDIQVLLDSHEKTNEDGIATFHDFNSSSLDIQVIYFIKEIEFNAYLRIREEISLAIMKIVLDNGGDFAFPTRTLHIVAENASPQ